MTDKATITNALRRWIAQRPGLEFGNYGDEAAYRSELRRITRMRHDAEKMLAHVERSNMTADELLQGFRAFSGRLSWIEDANGGHLDYCTGQYWPTEYRAAACAVLASALRNYWRAADDPAVRNGMFVGRHGYIRECFRRNFGKRLADRWAD